MEKLNQKTKFVNYLPHNEAIKELSTAKVLILLMNDTNNVQGIIPGKFFEYLATRRFILCVGSLDSDLNQILTETQSGQMIEFHDKENLEILIDELFENYLKNELNSNSAQIENYTRKSAAQKVIKLINSQ